MLQEALDIFESLGSTFAETARQSLKEIESK
jgi:hypothetical protein